jgi:predicted Zn finger-like uncharacterized protein|tara:strand:- start:295 stop:783 length:489 start_codon:yes stop_codon:yes gene_type:complete
MIISCPSCLKKFKIEETLIPSKGRNLQCGSCNYNWFYKIENKTVEPLKLEENIEEKIEDSDESLLFSSTSGTLKTKLDQELDKDVKNNDITHNSDLPKKSENITFSKFLSYIIVSIISFAVFVVLIDTIKTPLIDIFPGLEILLFNLFETLQDIKLFIIDLS